MRLGGTSYAEMTVSKWTMEQFASQLSVLAGHVEGGALVPVPVVDTTGLTGTYDFKLKWADDQNPNADPNLPPLLKSIRPGSGY